MVHGPGAADDVQRPLGDLGASCGIGHSLVGGPAEIIYSGYRDRAASRALEFLQPIAKHFRDPEALDEQLAASDQLDTIFGRALRAAAESGLAEKRTALGRVVVAALTDEAIVQGYWSTRWRKWRKPIFEPWSKSEKQSST